MCGDKAGEGGRNENAVLAITLRREAKKAKVMARFPRAVTGCGWGAKSPPLRHLDTALSMKKTSTVSLECDSIPQNKYKYQM